MTEAWPTLSVVIPTYNRADSLQRAVESALIADAEVVVVDDASDDDTARVMNRYTARGVKYVRLEKNRGPCFARNVGVERATSELVLFLDDDDKLLPGAGEVIRRVARERPGHDLYLHNCVYPNDRLSIQTLEGPTDVTYDEWLDGRWDHELKPVVRRKLFDGYSYDDTGASGEGLLWGRVIRDRGALASPEPIVSYDTAGDDRLTSGAGLLARAAANAWIWQQWLAYFGEDLKRRRPERWARRVQTAALYCILSRQRDDARRLIGSVPAELAERPRIALTIALYAPLPLLRLIFLAQRREVLVTARSRNLLRTLFA